MRRIATGVASAVVLVCLAAADAGAAGRSSFDPFRSDAGSGAALSPFRVAQGAGASTGAATPTPTPTTETRCVSDDGCPAENFCSEGGVCQVIQTRTNILYLYYREGSFTEVLGLYWSKRGPSGYRV